MFQFEDCGKAFIRVSSSKRHKTIHTGELPNKCDYCGQSFCHPDTFAAYMCDICSKTFYCAKTLYLHRRCIKESFIAHRETKHLGKGHSCEQCEKLFSYKARLKELMKIHTGENQSIWCMFSWIRSTCSVAKTHDKYAWNAVQTSYSCR